MISVRSLQRSEGDVSDPISNIFLITRQVDLAMSVCPFLRKLVSENLIPNTGNIKVGTTRIGQLYPIAAKYVF